MIQVKQETFEQCEVNKQKPQLYCIEGGQTQVVNESENITTAENFTHFCLVLANINRRVSQ